MTNEILGPNGVPVDATRQASAMIGGAEVHYYVTPGSADVPGVACFVQVPNGDPEFSPRHLAETLSTLQTYLAQQAATLQCALRELVSTQKRLAHIEAQLGTVPKVVSVGGPTDDGDNGEDPN